MRETIHRMRPHTPDLALPSSRPRNASTTTYVLDRSLRVAAASTFRSNGSGMRTRTGTSFAFFDFIIRAFLS